MQYVILSQKYLWFKIEWKKWFSKMNEKIIKTLDSDLISILFNEIKYLTRSTFPDLQA